MKDENKARVTFDEQPEKKDHCWCAETCCASLPNCRFVDTEAAGQEQDLWEKMLIRYDQARILRRGLKEVAKELMQEYTLTRKL